MNIGICGAGGHAREVADIIGNQYTLVSFIDLAPSNPINGIPVVTWQQFTREHKDAVVAVAIGNQERRKIAASLCDRDGYTAATVIHPTVDLSNSVEIGDGSIIFSGCILTVDIQIGRHVHINVGCTVSHDARIGDFSFLAPGVHVSGNVHIGRSVWIGTGVSIINGTDEEPLVIGDNVVIGAGACVTKPCEPGCLYVGVPAVMKPRSS